MKGKLMEQNPRLETQETLDLSYEKDFNVPGFRYRADQMNRDIRVQRSLGLLGIVAAHGGVALGETLVYMDLGVGFCKAKFKIQGNTQSLSNFWDAAGFINTGKHSKHHGLKQSKGLTGMHMALGVESKISHRWSIFAEGSVTHFGKKIFQTILGDYRIKTNLLGFLLGVNVRFLAPQK